MTQSHSATGLLIQRLLAKSPDKRIRSAAIVRESLMAIGEQLHKRPQSAPTPRKSMDPQAFDETVPAKAQRVDEAPVPETASSFALENSRQRSPIAYRLLAAAIVAVAIAVIYHISTKDSPNTPHQNNSEKASTVPTIAKGDQLVPDAAMIAPAADAAKPQKEAASSQILWSFSSTPSADVYLNGTLLDRTPFDKVFISSNKRLR